MDGGANAEVAVPPSLPGAAAAPAPEAGTPPLTAASPLPAAPTGFALPFPLALALLCGGLVLSIWGAVRTGVPDLALFGAAVVAALAGLYLVSYSRRPMQPVPLPPVPEEEFDDPVEEADKLATSRAAPGPAATPVASTPEPPIPASPAAPSDPGPLPEGAVPNLPRESP